MSYSPSTAGKKAEATALGLLPGGQYYAPKDTAVVKATLVDRQTGGKVADLISSDSETVFGVAPPISVGSGHGFSLISAEKLVLRYAAWGLASKIDEKIKQS